MFKLLTDTITAVDIRKERVGKAMADENKTTSLFSLVNTRGGDFGHRLVPEADAQDMQNGATRIPGSVTILRRAGESIRFVQTGRRRSWHWLMPDREKIYHG